MKKTLLSFRERVCTGRAQNPSDKAGAASDAILMVNHVLLSGNVPEAIVV